MIIVDDNTKQVLVKIGGSPTTNELDWSVSYSGAMNPAEFDGVTTGATPVAMCPVVANPSSFPPSIAQSRTITTLSVFNADTVPQIVTITYKNASASRVLVKINLGVNYTLSYEAGEGWYTIDDNGARVNIIIAIDGIAIGDTVVGAVPNYYLYVDGSGNLAQGWVSQVGNNVMIEDTKFISSENGNIQVDFGSGAYYKVTTDAGAGGESILSMTNSIAFLGTPAGKFVTGDNASGNDVSITTLKTEIQHGTKIELDSPIVDVLRTLNVGLAATQTGIINLRGTTSGVVSITTPDIAGTWTLTLPINDGDAGQVLTTDGSGVTSWTTNGVGTVTGTGAASQLTYWTAASVVSGDANTLIDGTNYLFGYTALAATELAGFQKNQNASTTVAITNTTSGTAGLAALNISNSATLATLVFVRSLSAAYTTSGINVADAAVVGTSKAAGMNVGTTTATQLSFWTNNAKRASVLSTGEFLVGYAALASAETMGVQINANANTLFLVSNTTSGTAGKAQIALTNSATFVTGLGMESLSAAFTTSGIRVQNSGVLVCSKTAGLNIGTNAATPMAFWTNNVEVGRFNSTGEFGIGMTPVNLLDVQKDQNGPTILSCLNANATGAAQAQVRSTNGTYNNVLSVLGTAFTTSGLNQANLSKLVTTSTVGLLIQSNVAATNIWIAIGGATAANEVARFDANGLSFQNALMGLTFKVQANSSVGRATLVAGTIAVTITGLTTSHKAFVQLQAAGGTLGVGFTAVCTANTLTITSVVAAGTINITDTSTLDYLIILTN